MRLLVSMAVLAASPAFADSWLPAQRTTYLSPDKATRLTVVPRDLKSSLAYFTDKVENKEPAGQRRGGEAHARGILERRSGKAWTRVWDAPLLNDVAPVRALVANEGQYVVTFDNWHSAGLGENVVVIYRADGTPVRAMKLTDILPEDYVRALPRSVSSLWWGGEHALSRDGTEVILKVVVPSGSAAAGGPVRGYVDVSVDLATGTVAPLTSPSWTSAMAAAAPLTARSKSAEATWRAQTIAALTAPVGAEVDEWRRYLHQARVRLAPVNAAIGFDPVWILPASSSPEFAERAKDIREVLTDWDTKSDLAFASPAAPEVLARMLIESAEQGPAGRLAGSRLFVALPAALIETVRSALGRTGATVIVFDPSVPIPQRPEALRKLNVDPDRVETEAARATAEARRFQEDAVRLDALAPPEPQLADNEGEGVEEMADRLAIEAKKAEATADRAAK